MPEDSFVEVALALARGILQPPLRVVQAQCLLYRVTVDNTLTITVDPRSPRRGQSAFQTDLCVLEDVSPEIALPRVVMEFKGSVTTHDVITYSAKARKHKQIYPYLRYGLIASREVFVPGRFIVHDEELDFCMAVSGLNAEGVAAAFADLITAELEASRMLERMAFEEQTVSLFRREPVLEELRNPTHKK